MSLISQQQHSDELATDNYPKEEVHGHSLTKMLFRENDHYNSIKTLKQAQLMGLPRLGSCPS